MTIDTRVSSFTVLDACFYHPADAVSDSSDLEQSDERVRLRNRRRSFLVFVRILLKCIDRAGDRALASRVCKLVEGCIQQHRRRGQRYDEEIEEQEQDGEEESRDSKSLCDAVESELELLVGEDYWVQARAYLKHYHRWKKERTSFRAALVQQQRSSNS